MNLIPALSDSGIAACQALLKYRVQPALHSTCLRPDIRLLMAFATNAVARLRDIKNTWYISNRMNPCQLVPGGIGNRLLDVFRAD